MEHEKEIDSCPICLDEIGEKNNCVTECGHKFCLKCLSIALQGNNTCPMCRAELVSRSEDAIENERLKTTLMILNQKMKTQEDNEDLQDKWKAQCAQKESQV